MKRVLSSFIIFTFLYLSAHAQSTGSVRGSVTDENGAMEFVNVGVENLSIGTVTAPDGSFLLQQLPAGTHRLIFSFLGFEKSVREVEVKSGETIKINVRMHANTSQLNEVVVTGTLREVTRGESPVPVEIYKPSLFRKNPVNNLFESLQMVNGLQPQINCNVCGTGDIHINGMEGAYTMVTIDGMPVVSSLSTVYGLMGIPTSMIQRIEVVKGPASTLYGSEAMAGVINIITKNPLAAPKLSVDVWGTTQSEWNVDAGLKAKVGKAHTLLGVNGYFFNNRLDVNHDNFTDVPLQKRYSIFNKWSFARQQNRQAAIAGRWLQEDRWGGEMQWTPDWRGTDSIYGESVYTNRIELLGNYDLPVDEKITLQFSYNYHHQDAAYGDIPYIASQHVAFGQLLWTKKVTPRHTLLAGVPFRFQYYNDNTPATMSNDLQPVDEPDRIFLPGIFFQNEMKLHEKMTVLAGLRYEYAQRHGNVFSPRLALKFALNDNNVFRLSGGNGFRVVNLFTEDHAALTGSREVVIAGNLQPERSWNAHLNFHRFQSFSGGFVSVDASLFYTYFTNKIIADFFTDATKIIYDNLDGHAVSRGGSLNLEVVLLKGFKATGGFTIADVFSVERDDTGDFSVLPQIHSPLFSATFSLGYTHRPTRLTFDFNGRVNGPMWLPVLPDDYRPEMSPWHGLMNVQVTKAFSFGMEIFCGVKNILNFIPEHPLMRPFDPFDKSADDVTTNPLGYTFDTAYNYAPLQGVRGFFGLRYSWN